MHPAVEPELLGIEEDKVMLLNQMGRAGDIKWGLVALLFGLPLPLVVIAFLFIGGCPGGR
jgi:hypothetical protein